MFLRRPQRYFQSLSAVAKSSIGCLELDLNPWYCVLYAARECEEEFLDRMYSYLMRLFPNIKELHVSIRKCNYPEDLVHCTWVHKLQEFRGLQSLSIFVGDPVEQDSGHFDTAEFRDHKQHFISLFNHLCRKMIDSTLGFRDGCTVDGLRQGWRRGQLALNEQTLPVSRSAHQCSESRRQ